MQKSRGAYAKGIAKRREIMEKALSAFSRSGYLATSMREIASASELTQAGLLHHFPNKETLLLAIIEEREAKQLVNGTLTTGLSWQDRVVRQLEINIENRTETLLFSVLAAEAEDQNHPAHHYMKERYRQARVSWETEFCKMRGSTSVSAEDSYKASLITAMWDGLQLQWLLDESFDMLAPFKHALKLLSA